jgi:molybdenum cofactor biosynthesis enzyme MoaA
MTSHHLTEVAAGTALSSWIHQHDRDQLSRKLRISLTDACNLTCFFCHNEGQGPPTVGPRKLLSIDEFARIVRAAVRTGIREVKLTGGEPLLYRESRRTIVDLVRALADLREEPFGLSMTTNGVLLDRYALPLKAAGLDRVTVSLHTLDQARFTALIGPRTRPGLPERIVKAIRSAVDVGLTPVKVNTAIIGSSTKGNVSELKRIVDVCRSSGVAKLRLYTLLRHAQFSDHERWYRFWDRQLLEEVGIALYGSPREARDFATRVEAFVSEWTGRLYPKPTFVALAENLEVEIEAMEAGRFSSVGVSDEGAYALRLSSDGVLRGALTGRSRTIHIRDSGDDTSLEEAFRVARKDLLPS